MDFVVDVHNITEKERIVASAPFSKLHSEWQFNF
jgi:hypothetical protein